MRGELLKEKPPTRRLDRDGFPVASRCHACAAKGRVECEHREAFVCGDCSHVRPWSFGASDQMPELCDACFRAPPRRPVCAPSC